MNQDNKRTRDKLKAIYKIKTFEDLIEDCVLSEDERYILKAHYIGQKDFRYIGDMLGFAESTIKRKHKKILQKLNKLV